MFQTLLPKSFVLQQSLEPTTKSGAVPSKPLIICDEFRIARKRRFPYGDQQLLSEHGPGRLGVAAQLSEILHSSEQSLGKNASVRSTRGPRTMSQDQCPFRRVAVDITNLSFMLNFIQETSHCTAVSSIRSVADSCRLAAPTRLSSRLSRDILWHSSAYPEEDGSKPN